MRGRLLASLAALVVAGALSGRAHALEIETDGKPIYLDITESLLFDWHATLDDAALNPDPENVFDVRNILNFRLKYDFFTFGLRLDAAWFPNPPALPNGTTQYQDDIRPEEFFFKFRWKRMLFTVGDDYVAFGRGIALSLRKLDELGFDIKLRGFHYSWRHEYFETKLALGLTNVTNVDGVGLKLVPDPNDFVAGLRLVAKPTRWLNVGVHGVDIERRYSNLVQSLGWLTDADLQNPLLDYPERTWIAGGNVELVNVGGALNLYLEGDYQQTTGTRRTGIITNETDEDGLALYGEAQVFLKPVTILLEAKHYENWRVDSSPHPLTANAQAITGEFPYILPPSLERYDQRVTEPNDTTGVHARVDFAIPDTRDSVFLSGAGFWLDGLHVGQEIAHVYGGWEHKEGTANRWVVQTGYRHEKKADGKTGLAMFHFDLDLYWLLEGPHDIQLHWQNEVRFKDPDTDLADSYLEGTAYLTWNWAPHWSFTLQFEYLNDDANQDDWYYPGAYVQYRFTQGTFVRLFGGRSKGGLKCTGGVCRQFPEFEGIKLEATARF